MKTKLMPGMQLLKTDVRKHDKIITTLMAKIKASGVDDDTCQWLQRLIVNSMDILQAAQARIHIDAGFKGMGANIMQENAMRINGDIRNLGRDMDRLFQCIDPTATEPIPDIYSQWLAEHEPQLVENYSGMTVAILIRDGVVVGPVAAVKRGDYKAAFIAAKALGYDLNQIQLENMPD